VTTTISRSKAASHADREPARLGEARLSWLFAAEPSRVGRVGILMATLECARQRFIEALQHEQYGEVYLRYHDPVAIAEGSPPASADEEEQRKRRRRPAL